MYSKCLRYFSLQMQGGEKGERQTMWVKYSLICLHFLEEKIILLVTIHH